MNENKYSKCICPRGRYSRCCNVEHHRQLAIEIDKYELTSRNRYAPTISEKIAIAVDRCWRLIGKGLLIVFIGLLLVVIGNTIRQMVTSEPIPAIIERQTSQKKVTAPRNPELLPSLEEAFSKPIVVDGEETK